MARRVCEAGAVIGILYEHPTWLTPLFGALERRGATHRRIDVSSSAFDLDDDDPGSLYVNRLSASSYDRGNQDAVAFALSYIGHLVESGATVLNGRHASLEVNKVDQMRAFRRHGLAIPRTIAFNDADALTRVTEGFPFPALVKPSQGGAGCLIVRFDTRAELLAGRDLLQAPPDGLLLLQEFIDTSDDQTRRVEILGGEVLYTLLSTPGEAYNACPADGGTSEGADFDIGADPEPELASRILAMFAALDLDFGSVEYRIDAGGTPRFFDLNLNSNYHPTLPSEWPEGGWGRFADHLVAVHARIDAERGA